MTNSILSGRGMQCSLHPVFPFFFIHFAPMFPKIFVALNVQFYEIADFDRVDFSSTAVADLMHSFPKDVFILFLIDVFALVVRFDGKFHLLHCPLLGV